MTGCHGPLYKIAMFGFSLQKLLVLAAIVAIVWYGFKYVGRLQEMRDAQDQPSQPRTRKRRWPGPGRSKHPAEAGDAEDMVQCPVCDAYVPARGASNCGRADCPY